MRYPSRAIAAWAAVLCLAGSGAAEASTVAGDQTIAAASDSLDYRSFSTAIHANPGAISRCSGPRTGCGRS
jgi:hypothetical protein